jgi:hypothetical protein
MLSKPSASIFMLLEAIGTTKRDQEREREREREKLQRKVWGRERRIKKERATSYR